MFIIIKMLKFCYKMKNYLWNIIRKNFVTSLIQIEKYKWRICFLNMYMIQKLFFKNITI